ncbi:L,D-transpeptidase family protein [Longibacter sp.]|jgi:murein L,D-transpeptidase YcbB/YkuD|uniref:L,D-transpeptidase family protein n=1 Tax=Longibacter sp. TaxID=2045415 RepID=UPI003EBF1A1B
MLMLLWTGCQTGEGAPGVEDASTTAYADSLRARVVEGIRTRVESEVIGLDGLPPNEESRPLRMMRWYEETGFQPLWVDGTGPLPVVERLLGVLTSAADVGLSPEAYPAGRIDERVRAVQSADSMSVADLVELELLCTSALWRYAMHRAFGRISPGEVTPTWNMPMRTGDVMSVLRRLSSSGDLDAALASVTPATPAYAELQNALRQYRDVEVDGGWPAVPDGPSLKPGEVDRRVPSIRERLAVTGDLTVSVDSVRARIERASSSPPTGGEVRPEEAADAPTDSLYRYDDGLEAAVVRFQRRHGLTADGVIGDATRAAMNVPAERRVAQLVANLERWRWMPDSLGARYVLVNIAGFSLDVVEEGRTVLSMRVVTGRPYRQTPVFSDEISYLVFRPFWHIPHKLAVEDKLPLIRRDPSYLERQRIKVFRSWDSDAAPVDPATIDWSTVTAENFPFRLRQDAGPLNALGRVKFMFPNPYSVYLHDTPTRGLFQQAERSFSSGCIRVERPVELARYLLHDQPGWTAERVREEMYGDGGERAVVLQRRVPVHLQYWTAWVEDGAVHFRNDIYDRDAQLLRALEIDDAPS